MPTMLRDLVYSVAAYVVGYFAFVLAFAFAFGIEGGANPLPYYAAFGLLLGGLLGRWWLLPLPALHLYVVEPVRLHVLFSRHLPVTYTSDRLNYVLACTIAVAVGVVVRQGMRERASSDPRTSSPDVGR